MGKKGASLSFTLPDGTEVTIQNEDAQKLFQTLGGNTRPMQPRPTISPQARPMVSPQQTRQPIPQQGMGHSVGMPQRGIPQRRLPIVSAAKGIKNAPTDMLVLIHKGESVIPAKRKKK